jgi:hypothetical protein
LTFDLSVTGHEGDDYYGEFNWPLIKVFGKTLEEYGFTSGNGKVTVSMDALVAAYDMQAKFLAGEVSNVAQTNYWFTIDRVNDYDRYFNLAIINYKYEIPPKAAIEFVNANDEIVEKGQNLQLAVESDYEANEIIWSTSDSTVAIVENGVVTGVNGGAVTITASVDGFAISKKVYVASADYINNNFYNTYKIIIDDLKNNKIRYYNENLEVKVVSSKATIDKLLENESKAYNFKKDNTKNGYSLTGISHRINMYNNCYEDTKYNALTGEIKSSNSCNCEKIERDNQIEINCN